jgi:hypothetical protein
MARPYLGLSLLLPMIASACGREPVSLGGNNAEGGQAGSGSPSDGTGGSASAQAGTGGATAAEAGTGAGAQAGSRGVDATPECVLGGCSSQLCVDEGESTASDCGWLEEYACYRTARCELQNDRHCGWTQTAELRSCIQAAREGGSGGTAGEGPALPEGGSTEQTGGRPGATGGHPAVTGGSSGLTGGSGGHQQTGGSATGGNTATTGGSGLTGGSGGQTDCFAPDQNLEQAMDGTMEGCPCTGSKSICISGGDIIELGLACSDGRWNKVKDGPCLPLDFPCTGQVETASQCVDLFETCHWLSTGGYCGQAASTDQCADGLVVAGPQNCLDIAAASYCHRLDNGAWCTGVQVQGCPRDWTPLDTWCIDEGSWCSQVSASQSCQLPVWDMAECSPAGGTVRSDPGDGSLMHYGCADEESELASLSGFVEGGLCCYAGADRRIGIHTAYWLVNDWAYSNNPDLTGDVEFDITEYDVPDLWETLRVQLFSADYVSADGQRFNSGLWAYYQGVLYPFGSTMGGHGLMSGVLQGDAFYYSYSWGSGIHRSVLGKLTIGEAGPEFVESGGFSSRDLFLAQGDDEIAVEDGTYRGYDDWMAAEPFGTLVDRGTELAVVDSEGQEIVPEF